MMWYSCYSSWKLHLVTLGMRWCSLLSQFLNTSGYLSLNRCTRQTQGSVRGEQHHRDFCWPAVEGPREWRRIPSDLLHHRGATRLQVHMEQGWQCRWHLHKLHSARPEGWHRVSLPGHCCQCWGSECTTGGQRNGQTHQENQWVLFNWNCCFQHRFSKLISSVCPYGPLIVHLQCRMDPGIGWM